MLEAEERQAKLALTKARQLSVTVTDEEDKPIDRATVLVTTGDPLPYGALTGKAGVAVLERLGRPPWSVKVSAPGAPGTVGDLLAADGATEFSLPQLEAYTIVDLR